MPICPACGHDNGRHRHVCSQCQQPLAAPVDVAQVQKRADHPSALFCRTCGTVAPPKKHTPGSFLIEVILWLCFFIPGLIYSIWRISARRKVCAACGSSEVIPKTSPLARAAIDR